MSVRKDETRASVLDRLSLALGIAGGTILVVLLARTAVGAIDRQPAPMAIAALAALGSALGMAVWRLNDAARPTREWPRRAARAAAAVLSGLLFGLLVAQDSVSGVASVVVIALTWSVAATVRIWRTTEIDRITAPGVNVVPVANANTGIAADTAITVADDPSVQLQLCRRRTADGESIELHARLEFVAGAREAVLHVPFWPALAAPPDVECEPLEGDDIELRVTSAEPYGLRIEGRLASAATAPRTVLIGIEVRAVATSEREHAAA